MSVDKNYYCLRVNKGNSQANKQMCAEYRLTINVCALDNEINVFHNILTFLSVRVRILGQDRQDMECLQEA